MEIHTINYSFGKVCGEITFTTEPYLSQQEIVDRFVIWLLRWSNEPIDITKPHTIKILKTRTAYRR